MIISRNVLEKKERKIIIGDPSYFDEFKGKKLKSLTIDLKIPKEFYQEIELENESDVYFFKYYFGLNEKMVSLLKEGKRYSNQKESSKEIGVDTARYYCMVNENDDEISTGSDGYCGMELILKKDNKMECGYIEMCLPFDYSEKEAIKTIEYFFN